MNISKIEIYNFRSHKETSFEISRNDNVLIGQNNTGKTAFLEALNYAIGYASRGMPTEDDFFADKQKFDPKKSDSIRIIIEFKEDVKQRFAKHVLYVFDKAIQFDEEVLPDDPIRYIRLCYECKYDIEKEKYVEDRYFVDVDNKKLPKSSSVMKDHLSFFPFFYLTTLRDINREIKNKNSFWGKIRTSIDYSGKEKQIKDMIDKLNALLLKGNSTVKDLISKLQKLEGSLNIQKDSLDLQAFSKRNWELLDELNIYLKTANSNLSLPITKHGMGTQSIAIIIIFRAYLDILLPKIVDNEDAVSIVGIEEPEAHVHPHAQRAIFQQISSIKGQKIISTHSPFIVDRADIYNYAVFKIKNGITSVKKIPAYKKTFEFKHELPKAAYISNSFLNTDEELLVRRYIQYRNTELFFSSMFIMCEGDTEKVFIERIFPIKSDKNLGHLGISIISCEGQTHAPFLKISNSDAFDLNWLILSDGEEKTKSDLKNRINNCGYVFEDVEDRVFFLPKTKDFEAYYIQFYGTKEIKAMISQDYGAKAFMIFCKEFEKHLPKDGKSKIGDFPEDDLLNEFIDKKGKVKFAEKLAIYIQEKKLKIPGEIDKLISKAIEVVNYG